MDTEDLDCLVAVDTSTGEAFFPVAYGKKLQDRIAELEAEKAATEQQQPPEGTTS